MRNLLLRYGNSFFRLDVYFWMQWYYETSYFSITPIRVAIMICRLIVVKRLIRSHIIVN